MIGFSSCITGCGGCISASVFNSGCSTSIFGGSGFPWLVIVVRLSSIEASCSGIKWYLQYIFSWLFVMCL